MKFLVAGFLLLASAVCVGETIPLKPGMYTLRNSKLQILVKPIYAFGNLVAVKTWSGSYLNCGFVEGPAGNGRVRFFELGQGNIFVQYFPGPPTFGDVDLEIINETAVVLGRWDDGKVARENRYVLTNEMTQAEVDALIQDVYHKAGWIPQYDRYDHCRDAVIQSPVVKHLE